MKKSQSNSKKFDRKETCMQENLLDILGVSVTLIVKTDGSNP